MTLHATERLLQIMQILRDPERGCPWDQVQDFGSIVPHTLEEAYELAEAIEQLEPESIREELGDLLFQVVFYAQLGAEWGWFDFDAIAAELCEKLQRRHPHVFGPASGTEPAAGQWEHIKAVERHRNSAAGEPPGALTGVALNLPALSRAAKLQKRAARVGFDWSAPAPVMAKIEEELAELRKELDNATEPARIEEEFGDLLFACVNLARHAGLDPETALRRANRKFERRFRYIEQRLAARGSGPEDSTLEAMDALWEEAKLSERGKGGE